MYTTTSSARSARLPAARGPGFAFFAAVVLVGANVRAVFSSLPFATPSAAVVWVAVIGVGQGGSLGLALILPVLRGAGAAAVAGLTALTLSAG